MIKAVARMKDGRVALVLGLSTMNLAKMDGGQPIYFDLTQLKLKDGEQIAAVTIFSGWDEATMANTLQDLIGPDTEVIVVPQGDPRPQ